jgi:hypothetical protein
VGRDQPEALCRGRKHAAREENGKNRRHEIGPLSCQRTFSMGTVGKRRTSRLDALDSPSQTDRSRDRNATDPRPPTHPSTVDPEVDQISREGGDSDTLAA